jgi:hypothetical protein
MSIFQADQLHGVHEFFLCTRENILNAPAYFPGAFEEQYIYKPLNIYYDKI